MKRNYTLNKYVRNECSVFLNDKATSGIEKCFDFLYQNEEPQGCLYSSIINFAILSYNGYSPKLCYGLCKNDGNEFYHAWIELNGKILDIAIYGNTNFNPWNLGAKLDFPIIFKDFNEHIVYNNQKFDSDWPNSGIYNISIQKMSQYIENNSKVWNLLERLIGDVFKSSKVLKEKIYELLDKYDSNERGL